MFARSAVAQEAQSIFDGKSLDGWDGDRSFWSVENGELIGRETPEHQLARSTYLIWRGGTVSDFRLDLDFKIVGGNSGVQFRSRDQGEFQVAGYQADLEDGPDWSGCLYEQEGRGVCARRGQSVRFDADGSKSVLEVADGTKLLEHVRVQQWNHYTIVARGPSMSFAINDVPMTSVTDLDPAHFTKSGILALQLHQGFTMEVRFKNLRLIDYTKPAAPAAAIAAADPNTPQWIWSNANAKEGEHAFFRTQVEFAGGAPKLARLAGSADNACEVFIDGVSVLEQDDWTKPVFVDVTSKLGRGKHELAIEASNDSGPAAIQFALDCDFDDGAHVRTVTNAASWLASSTASDGWKLASFDAKGWKPATSLGPIGTGVWGRLAEPTAFEPRHALSGDELKVPEGFRAELLYTVPIRKQGSWVSMCFDDRGRIIASDQYGPLYRATIRENGATSAEQLPIALGSAQGLCYANDALYVVCSESGPGYYPGLWRAKHRASDDGFDPPELLKKFEGGGEHGPHAVVLGPDKQSLYVVGGNHTKVPAGISISRVAQCWGEDQLLPQHSDPNGHAVGITAPGGWICKTDFDGKVWELFAAGFRNTYDMAFAADGEAFTFDSDMEWDVGLPWYRPTMIEHVVPGGDYGWRTGSWRWPAYYEDSLPGAIDIGLASPTGMCFVPNRMVFELPHSATMLVGDWAYGRILAVRSVLDGATFHGTFEPFVQGKPLAVTDMQFGPDNALYFLVGGRRTQSAIYRVIYDPEPPRTASSVWSLLPDDTNNALRKSFDRFLGVKDEHAIDAGFKELDSSDRFIRYAARAAIEHQDASLWIPRALNESRPWASIEALIAVARRAPAEFRERALARFATLPIETMDEEHLLAALRSLELVLIRLGSPESEDAAGIARRLDALYPNASNFANRELCQLLIALDSADVIAKSMDLLARATKQEDQIAFAWALRTVKSGWTIDERERYFRWLNEIAGRFTGGFSFAKYLDNLRDDAVASLSADERAELGSLIEKPKAIEASASAPVRAFVKHWELEQLLGVAPRSYAGRDFARAATLYREARCYDCHRIASLGGGSGPDLTGAGNRFNDHDLIEAIVDPSKQISDQYQDTEVVTKDDELYVGRIEIRPNGDVRVTPAESTTPIEISAAEIASIRPHKLSRMPASLLDTFDEDEILDLLAYLRSGANPADPAFAPKK